ncbi:DEAD/DEAH box helicase [Streptomyces sp. SID13031]|uniref:DEAD/DEAH box helicase n=1 Tax=Streptomyces sp. SID13031 TaxID=2706046 RepID=UPI0013C823A4|nr:DEAD/DEAH box helicase [Streptomyces sp. SID13031]NEA30119.1 DEAD/DEAH box helicase [Streptomyces sp. SID13031]
MITVELGDRSRPTVLLTRPPGPPTGAWAHLQSLLSRGIAGGNIESLEVRAEVFLAELSGVREVRTFFGEQLAFGPRISSQLSTLASDRKAREDATSNDHALPTNNLAKELVDSGFTRVLKPFQLDNLARLILLPHGADFSVPGAGKTTVALANFALRRSRGEIARMLVIGPIAAFEAWKVDSVACLTNAPKLAVHAGPSGTIPRYTELLLTNYNRVAADYERIRDFVAGAPTQVVLDEAHRIKRGAAGVHGRAVLDLAYVARRRDILTGTPAPQGASDLVALMRFLYPGQDRAILPAEAYDESRGRDPDVVSTTSNAINRYFVRTPKSSLDIPDPIWETISRPMGPIQQAIYDALVGRYQGAFDFPTDSRRHFDRLGRIVMYLLEASTNPALLVAGSDSSDEAGFTHPPIELRGDEPLSKLLTDYNKYERPWKYDYVIDAVTAAAANGEKVLVWTTFVRNIRALTHELAAFNPAVVHGGIPPEDSAASGALTRETELARFRNDPDCTVLLANPAAAGEGVSLHHWCHHAIYLDRTFNAGHFLQSQDRIHRLGLDPAIETRFTLLMSDDSLDTVVNDRLREKVRTLADLMDDSGLVRVALPESDEDHDAPPAEGDDASAVRAHLRSE